MPKKNYKMFIEDIITAINKIQTYIKNMDYETFSKNDMVLDAVLRNLEILVKLQKIYQKGLELNILKSHGKK